MLPGLQKYNFLPDSYTGDLQPTCPTAKASGCGGATLALKARSRPRRTVLAVFSQSTPRMKGRVETTSTNYMCHLCVNSVSGLGVCTVPDVGQAAGEWRRVQFHHYGVNGLPDGRGVEGRWIKGNTVVASESTVVPCVAL